ncbi:putative F-box/LRR-repeat protein 23 [Gastrolobium bilobum]|uniref:putative F-box/LRR-repeat protein 23 n=1 Tax=Gastrolobium bilobum TaxID=150636 RepID=UPI002AB051D4|nr:putative F-box/LRR-repeat protein 23 [Gastrolobium bilobum]
MSSSSSCNTLPDSPELETRNWLNLPPDVTSMILLKLGVIEILFRAQFVCTKWWRICEDPGMWRIIDMRIKGLDYLNYINVMTFMCRLAIDRSCGQLVDITLERFAGNDLLKYIVNSTPHLRRLRLVICYGISDQVMSEAAKKLPLLEELDNSFGSNSTVALEAIGQSCPLLKSLKFNRAYRHRFMQDRDNEALAIAKTMPELRHLELNGNQLTNDGLVAILDGCPRLESLNLRRCFNLDLRCSLGKRCEEQIRDLRLPYTVPAVDLRIDSDLDEDDVGFYYDLAFTLIENSVEDAYEF